MPLLLLSLLPPLPLLLLLPLRAESFNPEEALEDLRSWCAEDARREEASGRAGEVCRADFWRSLVAAVRNDEGGAPPVGRNEGCVAAAEVDRAVAILGAVCVFVRFIGTRPK